MPMTMEEMEKEINLLHDALISRGVNSRRTADIFGREVSQPTARARARAAPRDVCARARTPLSTNPPRRRSVGVTPPRALCDAYARRATPAPRARRHPTALPTFALPTCLSEHLSPVPPPHHPCPALVVARFELPVNAEHKATVCNSRTCCSIAQPHMRTFWAATIGFFCTFFSCFAPGALGIYYKKPPAEGGLGLKKAELKTAGDLAVTGTILMRVLAGPMCDTWGARKTFIFLLLIGIPGMLVFMTAQSAAAFTLGRILIGLSLATFVTCQVWCSQFFDRSIVGKVNATAGGWGNLGGGVALSPCRTSVEFFLSITGTNIGASWRLCILVPIVMHLASAAFIATGRDLPDGSYAQLEKAGAKQKSQGGGNVAILGFTNTNALIMLVTYGLCFGVELTMNNKLVPYFTRYYGMRPTIAGPLGACFSLMNLCARSWGGCLSDVMAKRYGLRGRITAMWVVQSIEGVFCILMGMVTVNYDGPDDGNNIDTDACPKVLGVSVSCGSS